MTTLDQPMQPRRRNCLSERRKRPRSGRVVSAAKLIGGKKMSHMVSPDAGFNPLSACESYAMSGWTVRCGETRIHQRQNRAHPELLE